MTAAVMSQHQAPPWRAGKKKQTQTFGQGCSEMYVFALKSPVWKNIKGNDIFL